MAKTGGPSASTQMTGLNDLSSLREAVPSIVPSSNVTAQKFIQGQWIFSLKNTAHTDELVIDANSTYVRECKSFLKRWKRPRQYLDSQIAKLQGMLYLPPLILQNPTEDDELPYDKMETKTATFIWLNDRLRSLRLGLKSIITIDLLPFVTERWIKSLSKEDQRKALQESLNLTILFFKTYEVSTVLSCHCLGQRCPEWLKSIADHCLVKSLSSSVSGAQSRHVKHTTLFDRKVHVIQGFHPSYILKAAFPSYYIDRQRILSGLLTEVYTSCQEWKESKIKAECEETICQIQQAADKMRGEISRLQMLERQLLNHRGTSSEQVVTFYNETHGTGVKSMKFSIHTWCEILWFFLSNLPSSPMKVDLANNSTCTEVFPTEVTISSNIKQFVVDLLEQVVYSDNTRVTQ
jgi:hypothetical protein